MTGSRLRPRLAELEATPLRLRARTLADGLFGGLHRAERKGSGVEFAGHRPYTLGDDLRHLDRHALLRHGRFLVREFHTETQRCCHIVVDGSPSMHYRGRETSGAPVSSKLDMAALLAATLALAAARAGDPVGLSLLSYDRVEYQPARSDSESLERIIDTLETAMTSSPQNGGGPSGGGAKANAPAHSTRNIWRGMLSTLGNRLPRGSQVFVLSDFFDFDADLAAALGALGTQRRHVAGLQILSRTEAKFPFRGAVRFVDTEGSLEVETEADAARRDYLEALQAHAAVLTDALQSRGGQLARTTTDADPAPVLLDLVQPSRRGA